MSTRTIASTPRILKVKTVRRSTSRGSKYTHTIVSFLGPLKKVTTLRPVIIEPLYLLHRIFPLCRFPVGRRPIYYHPPVHQRLILAILSTALIWLVRSSW